MQVDWAVRCAKWWNKTLSNGGGTIARAALLENIQLFREGCQVCWSAMFLKCMVSLGMVGDHTVDTLRQVEARSISSRVFSEDSIREAYRSKYDLLYWDTHCTEPRNRGGRHTAFIKHNCWFYTEQNPVVKLNAWDRQVQALVRFRVGTHRLRCNDHSITTASRVCRLCTLGVVEDEQHVLMECMAYDDIRNRERYKHLFRREVTGTGLEEMKTFMNQKDQYQLSRLITAILMHRTREMDTVADIVNPVLDTE